MFESWIATIEKRASQNNHAGLALTFELTY